MYKQQKNFCSRLYKKERKNYYTNLDINKITDVKKFWKATKPFFSGKGTGKTDIILIEEDNIFQGDHEVAKILNDHFSNAVKALNIDIPSECKNNESTISSDPIDNIISTFSSHPSIKLINENVIKGNLSFDIVDNCAVEKEIAAQESKKCQLAFHQNFLRKIVISVVNL